MLEMLDIGIDAAVAYRVGGKITENEMKTALAALREKIERCGQVVIYQEVESIEGAELDAVIEKFKFLLEVGLSNIERIAVVAHQRWIQRVVDLEGRLFKKIAVKAFPIEERPAAIAFLKNPRRGAP